MSCAHPGVRNSDTSYQTILNFGANIECSMAGGLDEIWHAAEWGKH